MMGGGFGGCTLNLIHKDAIENFVKNASKAYKDKFNIDLTYFQTTLSQGTSLMSWFSLIYAYEVYCIIKWIAVGLAT